MLPSGRQAQTPGVEPRRSPTHVGWRTSEGRRRDCPAESPGRGRPSGRMRRLNQGQWMPRPVWPNAEPERGPTDASRGVPSQRSPHSSPAIPGHPPRSPLPPTPRPVCHRGGRSMWVRLFWSTLRIGAPPHPPAVRLDLAPQAGIFLVKALEWTPVRTAQREASQCGTAPEPAQALRREPAEWSHPSRPSTYSGAACNCTSGRRPPAQPPEPGGPLWSQPAQGGQP